MATAEVAGLRGLEGECSATIRMVAGDNQDGFLRHRLSA